MSQVVSRISQATEGVEILIKDQNKEYFKEISIREYIDVLKQYDSSEFLSDALYKSNIVFGDDVFIANGSNCVVINHKEHKQIVTYENKSYDIAFPNCIYLLMHKDKKIKNIEAYAYKKYEGLKTNLYQYPMPNMLSGNLICIGSAPREIMNNNYLTALNTIIFTQYTHSHVDNIKSFKDTITYFKYLESNPFPYDLLNQLNRNLREVING